MTHMARDWRDRCFAAWTMAAAVLASCLAVEMFCVGFTFPFASASASGLAALALAMSLPVADEAVFGHRSGAFEAGILVGLPSAFFVHQAAIAEATRNPDLGSGARRALGVALVLELAIRAGRLARRAARRRAAASTVVAFQDASQIV